MLMIQLDRIKKKMDSKGIARNEKADINAVKAFEKKYGIALPEELVAFYCEIGNGCDMIELIIRNNTVPIPGVHKLLPIEKWEFDADGISKVFPFEEYWIWEDEEDLDDDDERLDFLDYGNIPLIDVGDGETWNIIINGAQKGQMWNFSGVGIGPCSPPMSFLEWFEAWLDTDGNAYCTFEEIEWKEEWDKEAPVSIKDSPADEEPRIYEFRFTNTTVTGYILRILRTYFSEVAIVDLKKKIELNEAFFTCTTDTYYNRVAISEIIDGLSRNGIQTEAYKDGNRRIYYLTPDNV